MKPYVKGTPYTQLLDLVIRKERRVIGFAEHSVCIRSGEGMEIVFQGENPYLNHEIPQLRFATIDDGVVVAHHAHKPCRLVLGEDGAWSWTVIEPAQPAVASSR